jgi:hypothetical protein
MPRAKKKTVVPEGFMRLSSAMVSSLSSIRMEA